MHLEKDFSVAKARQEVAQALDDDATFETLFPDTSVASRGGGVRETTTQVALAGVSRELRFVFETAPDGNIHFHKICDGNIWRSLEGDIQLESLGTDRTRVSVSMEGKTRAFVPERAISGQMKKQLNDMVDALQTRIES